MFLATYNIHMLNNKRYSGFSLVELLIVLGMVGVLINISYFSYIGHIIKAQRSNAIIAMLDLAAQLEQYYDENYTYVGVKSMGKKPDYYQLEITRADIDGFLIKATPIGVQARQDYKCGTLFLDNLGNEGVSGGGSVGECWGA